VTLTFESMTLQI